MNRRLRLMTRIGLFAALVYLFSWVTLALPNISLAFFVAFAAGLLWGVRSGMLVGAFGMALWTMFNPYGPAALPISVAQVVGMSLSGGLGGLLRFAAEWRQWSGRVRSLNAVLLGLASVFLFYLPVNIVDAWLFQPFWPRFIAGAIAASISALFNAIVFPLLFPIIGYLYDRESLRP